MSTEVRRSTEKIVPLTLAQGEEDCRTIRVATIRGICCEWTVWSLWEGAAESGYTSYVLRVPTDGPGDFIANWGYESREATVFSAGWGDNKNGWRVFDAAVQFATKSASDEFLAEVS